MADRRVRCANLSTHNVFVVRTANPTKTASLRLIVNRPARRIADQLDGVAEGVMKINALGPVAVFVDGDAGLFGGGGQFFFTDVHGHVRGMLLGTDESELGAADV